MKHHNLRGKKLAIVVLSGFALVAVVIALLVVSDRPRRSGWPHVPPAELFVTTKPNQQDVAGVYELTRQTITANGLAALEGRHCKLDLRPDGSFTVTNYPQWSVSSTPPHVAAFISTTGRWRCDTLHMIYNGRSCWGVVFSDAQPAIDELALRSNGAPYDLMLTYGGDFDEGTVMTFGKKK
jgi:hypothetical protein